MPSVILYLDQRIHRFAYVPEGVDLELVLGRLEAHGYEFVSGRTGIVDGTFTNSERSLLVKLTNELDRNYKPGKPYTNGLERELAVILPGTSPLAKTL